MEKVDEDCRSVEASERINAAVHAAELKAKLEYQVKEAQVQLELQQKAIDFERTQLERELRIAEARFAAISALEAEESVKVAEVSAMNHLDSSHFTAPDHQNFHHSAQDLHFREQVGLEVVLKTLTEQLCLTRLPIPEPGIFCGEPLTYLSWKTAVSTLIDKRCIPKEEKIYYLRKYLGGQAKEAVEGYLLLATEDSYNEAMDLLESRYGDSFIVANAFRDKLEAWPKLGERDGAALRKLSDFLRQCLLAMKTIPSLQVLNDDRENKKVLMKLPEWLVLHWGRIVWEWRETKKHFPPFTEFVSFITKEANIACDPVTSLQSLEVARISLCTSVTGFDSTDCCDSCGKTLTGTRKSEEPIHARNTNQAVSHAALASKVMPTATPVPIPCVLCKGRHDLVNCDMFLSQHVHDRKNFALRRGLCFGCLEHGHVSKNCHQRKFCTICARRHPASLHGDILRSANARPVDLDKAKLEKVQTKDLTDDSAAVNHATSDVTLSLSAIDKCAGRATSHSLMSREATSNKMDQIPFQTSTKYVSESCNNEESLRHHTKDKSFSSEKEEAHEVEQCEIPCVSPCGKVSDDPPLTDPAVPCLELVDEGERETEHVFDTTWEMPSVIVICVKRARDFV